MNTTTLTQSLHRTLRTSFGLAAVIVLLAPAAPVAAEDLNSFATGGYASGLRTESMMHMMDTNKDGMLSKQEWTAFQERSFNALDKNKDRSLDEKEFTGPQENVAFATAAYARGLMTDTMFKKIDADRDGEVSRDEFVEYQQHVFQMLDTKKKGMVNLTDFIRPAG